MFSGVEGQRDLLEALFCQWLRCRAEPILVPATVVSPATSIGQIRPRCTLDYSLILVSHTQSEEGDRESEEGDTESGEGDTESVTKRAERV